MFNVSHFLYRNGEFNTNSNKVTPLSLTPTVKRQRKTTTPNPSIPVEILSISNKNISINMFKVFHFV